MKLAHVDLNQVLEVEVAHPYEWVVENPELFAKYVRELLGQARGEEGEFVFSISEKIFPVSKKVEIILNPFAIDINDKRIISKLYGQLNEVAYSEKYYMYTQEILQKLHQYIYELEQESRHILCADENIELVSIFKALGVRQEVLEEDFREVLCRYVKIIGEVLGIKLVVFVNLRSYMTDEQISSLITDVSYEDIGLLLMESCDRGCLNGVKRFIIDRDLCEI